MDKKRDHGVMTPLEACQYLKLSSIPNLVFDLDDTLYYRKAPFVKAVERNFPGGCGVEAEELYRVNQIIKEEEFNRHIAGEITLEQMQINRTGRTFAAFGIDMTDKEAAAFEAQYTKAQGEITMVPEFKELFDWLRKEQPARFLGIMTNGNEQRQWNKIRQLQLDSVIPEAHVYTSEGGGAGKPHVEAFRNYEHLTGVRPEETILIGDSQEADRNGALNAGWHALLVNGR